MDRIKFEEDSKQKRRDNTDALTAQTLAKMLKCDVRMFDTHYIRDRVIQIINETIRKLNFKNKEIEKARKAFLDVLIDGMKKNPFTIDDEIKEAKKGIKSKDKEKKRKAVDRLSKLERVRDKTPGDVTEERDVECEPVCQHIARTILSRDWLLKDSDYTTGAIELDDELLITINAMSYVNELFEQVYNSLDRSYLNANEKLWGCRREKIRLGQLDNRLKE